MTVVWNNPVRGNFRNWLLCARILLNEDTTSKWVMVCEDDILWAQDSFSVLTEELISIETHIDVSTLGAISLFFPRRMSKLNSANKPPPRGYLHEGMQVGKKMWGAQCMLFQKSFLRELAYSEVMASYERDPRWHKNVDLILAVSIEHMRKRIYWRSPGLVHHELGHANSSLGYAERPNLLTDAYEDPACPV